MAQSALTLAALLLTLLLSGCASYRPAALPDGINSTPQKTFTATGKIGIRSADSNDSARFSWSQRNDRYQIQLFDPFGRQLMDLNGQTGQVSLQLKGDTQRYSASTPESLMLTLLGWQVPVRSANFWIQGHPDPGLAVEQISGSTFRQSDWLIELLAIQETTDGINLPRKLRLSHQTLQITLIIANWQFVTRN